MMHPALATDAARMAAGLVEECAVPVETLDGVVVATGTSVTVVLRKMVDRNVCTPLMSVTEEEVIVKTAVELLKRVVTWPGRTANGLVAGDPVGTDEVIVKTVVEALKKVETWPGKTVNGVVAGDPVSPPPPSLGA